MLVTVVVTSYNRLPLLRRCLASVEAQTHREWECLVCDDGSTDGSHEYVRELSVRDPRFRLALGPRFGLPAGPRNRGIAEARADWVAFLDDDDLWHPSKLERQVAVAREAGVDAVSTALVMFPGDTQPVWQPHDPTSPRDSIRLERILLHQHPYPSTPTVLIRRDRLLQVGGFAEHIAYRAVEDYDLWSRLQSLPGFEWPWIGGHPLSAAREHGDDSISAWKRWFHPDNVRQRWAMLEILTRLVATHGPSLSESRGALLADIIDVADDCAHRSAMLGWRGDSLFAYRLSAAFCRAAGDAVGALKRHVRAMRYAVLATPSAPAERLPQIAPLRERVERAGRAILAGERLPMDPLPLDGRESWSSLGEGTPAAAARSGTATRTA